MKKAVDRRLKAVGQNKEHKQEISMTPFLPTAYSLQPTVFVAASSLQPTAFFTV